MIDIKTKAAFNNQSGLEFKDISQETERTYRFQNGETYTIKEPLYLNVSKSGGHRLFSNDGTSHYVQPKEGWVIYWKVGKGEANFVK